MLPAPAPEVEPFTLLSWLSTPPEKIAGHAGARITVCGVLAEPSTVTTMLDELLPARPVGTCRLIWPDPLYRTVAARPSNVTDTFLPARLEPMMVASDPATSGVASKVAAF